MDIGDLVICRIVRSQSGVPTESHWIREVLATDLVGNPTHVCLVGNPTGEAPAESNTLEHQSIVVIRKLSEEERRVLEVLPQLSRKPLDEKIETEKGWTYLEFLEVLVEIRDKGGSPV